MRSIPPLMLCFGLPVLAGAAWGAGDADVPAPHFHVGDRWVFDDVNESGKSGFNEQHVDLTVRELVTDGTMTVGIKREGAPEAYEDHLIGTDWSQRHLVDGHETTTTRPFTFPLRIGAHWTVDYVDPTRRGRQISVHVRRTYTVAGWEDVEVPAGHFHAIRVVAEGVDDADLDVPAAAGSAVTADANGSTSVSHSQPGGKGKLVRLTRGSFYYVPALKNEVRSVEDQYDTDNVRVSRKTRTLIRFSVDDGGNDAVSPTAPTP